MHVVFLLALGLAVATAVPTKSDRIIGGSLTTINQYPYGAVMLYSVTGSGNFRHSCGGAIINNRSILSAAHCFVGDWAVQWRIRVGSSYAHSGGIVHNANSLINHAGFSWSSFDNDVAVVRLASSISFNNNVAPASIAGSNYNVGDNQAVWAIGWGRTSVGGATSEQLRHVQVWTVNQATCANRYARIRPITNNMLCSGWLDVGGRDQCQGDSGGPLIHNNVIVGICSWGESCALAYYPGVNARVSSYTSWIQNNA